MREVNVGYGYGCMYSTTIHFGVSSDKRCDLKIWFPSGITITRTNLSPGQLLIIEEQTGWAKSVALCQRAIMHQLRSRRNQIEFFKIIGLVIVLTAALLVLKWKKIIAVTSPVYLIAYPLLLKNVFHLVEQIKLNVRKVNIGVTRLFTCDVVTIIQRALTQAEKEVELHLVFDESYTTKFDGKGGFGLYYSRRTLEKYGGSIEVIRSSKNRGTTFLVRLRGG